MLYTTFHADTKISPSKRTIEMTPMLAAILSEHRTRIGGELDQLVFPGRDGKYMKSDVLVGEFRKTLKKSGIRRIRWHDLHHTYAGLMFALGESYIYVQKNGSQPAKHYNE
jgi:integrase